MGSNHSPTTQPRTPTPDFSKIDYPRPAVDGVHLASQQLHDSQPTAVHERGSRPTPRRRSVRRMQTTGLILSECDPAATPHHRDQRSYTRKAQLAQSQEARGNSPTR